MSGSLLETFLKTFVIEKNIKIHTCQDGVIDYTEHTSDLIQILKNNIKAQEITLRKKQAKNAIIKMKDNNISCTTKLIGYKFIKNVAQYSEKIDIVKNVFKMFFKNESKRKILIYMRDNGLKTCTTKDVTKLLKNPKYAGYYYNNGELIVDKSLKEIAIITLEEHREIINKLEEVRYYTCNNNAKHITTGLCFCGYCGNRMYVRDNNGTKEIRCINYCQHLQKNEKEECKSNMIRLDKYDAKESYGISEFLKPFSLIYFLRNIENNIDNEKTIEKEKELKDIKEKIKQLEIKIEKMIMEGEDIAIYDNVCKKIKLKEK